MKRQKTYECEEDRLDGFLERLPQRTNQLLAPEDIVTSKQLRKTCMQYGIDVTNREKKDLMAAVQDEVFTCAICVQNIRYKDHLSVILCGHEYHTVCIRVACHKELVLTGSMPKCPLCRIDIR
jgi:hypothetical protein